MKFYRLKQRLFNWPWVEKSRMQENRDIVLAYDVIYNLLHEPLDMTADDILSNAKVVLEMLGTEIGMLIGEDIFETEEPTKQQAFNLGDIIDEQTKRRHNRK